MSTFVTRRFMSALVMNASAETCMVIHPMPMGVIRRGSSGKLNDCGQSEQYSSHEMYNLMIQISMPQVTPRINEGIASRMTTPYRNLLFVKRHILRYTDSVCD